MSARTPGLGLESGSRRQARATLRTLASAFLRTNSFAAVLVAALLVVVVAAVWAGPTFFSANNFTNLTQYTALPILIGACASVGLLAGVVDLSVGAMVGLSAAVFSVLGSAGWPVLSAAGAAVGACLLAGAVNAIAVVRLGANTIGATVGMLAALSGMTLALIGTIPPAYIVNGLFVFSYGKLGPCSLPFLLSTGVCIVIAVVVGFTRPGRHVRAVGGDPVAAARAGINVKKLQTLAFFLSALGGAVAGILYVGQNGGAGADIGTNITFQVFGALMIGGFSIVRGGVGNPIGGIFGLLVIGVIGLLLDQEQINSDYLNMILGAVLILAVLIDRLRGGDRFD